MTGRKVIPLSDGTGNSSGKNERTNIWRIYQTIDTSGGDQVVFYDDGVGTEGFKLLRYLGGAFGYGMARNARQLYESLCRHYRDRDDKVLLFGFSRGAFTIRVVSALIQHCGIIDRNSGKTIRIWSWSRMRPVDVSLNSDEGLKAGVRLAYRYMRRRGHNPPVQALVRMIHDFFAYKVLGLTPFRGFRTRFSVSPRPRIAFLGVFETVSAYGLPIDEMAIAIDRWVMRLLFPDMILSRKVDHACQAFAMDEARHSFHQMLWTEEFWNKYTDEWQKDPRPHQVWFAGMHADVGGGYGDDRLSYIPLQWMLGHASRSAGLRLREELFEEFYENTGVAGVMHDSRRGLASFYRYKPRTWERLHCQDMDGNGNPEVKVERFLVDQSIFDRIKASGADSAPVGIPEDYDGVTWARQPGGTLVETVQSAAQAGLESPGQRSTRASLQDAALDLIFWRQLLYYLMLAIALTLVIVPLLWLPNPSLISSGLPSQIVGIIAAVLEYTPVPKASQIGLFWKQHAPSFLLLAGTFVLAWGISAGLGKRIQSIAHGAWRHLVDPAHIAKAPPVNSWIRFWRSRNAGIHRVWAKRALPLITVLVLFVVLPLMPVWRWYLCGLSAAKASVQSPMPMGRFFSRLRRARRSHSIPGCRACIPASN